MSYTSKGVPSGCALRIFLCDHSETRRDDAIPDVVPVLAIGEPSSATFGC